VTREFRLLPVAAVLLVAVAGAVVLGRYGLVAAFDAALLLLGPVLWLLVLTLSCWGSGQALWSRLGPERPWTLGDATVALALGAAVLMASAALLAVLHLLRPAALMTVLAVTASRGAVVVWRGRDRWPTVEASWLWLILAAVGGVTLVATSAPSPFYDQWHYHLGIPYQWLRAATVEAFPRHAYSFYWANMGLLYTYPLAGPGAWAAQVSNWFMAALATLGTAALAVRLSPLPRTGLLAAVILATTPALFEPATVATADLGLAVFGIAAWLCLVDLAENRLGLGTGAVICGALAGVAAGCKYLGLANVVIPIGVVVVVLAGRRREGGTRLRSMVITGLAFGLAATVVVAPWAARNTLTMGQPFYPFLSGVATAQPPNSGLPGELSGQRKDFELSPARAAKALTLGTFDPQDFAGNIGPVYLWLLPLWLLWHCTVGRGRHTSWVILGGFLLGLALTSGAWHLGRYLLPILPLAAAGTAAAWADFSQRLPRALGSVLWALLAVVLVSNLDPNRTTYLLPQLRVALGRLPADELLAENVTCWQAYRWVNAELPAQARVLMVAESRPLGIDRDLLLEDPHQEPLLVQLA
jgi:hypothetical protein